MPAKSVVKKVKSNKTGLSEDILLGLYISLVKTRTTDERLRKLFRQGRFAGTYFSAVGQEATTVGPTYGLRKDDIIAPSHREIGAAITKGIPLEKMIKDTDLEQRLVIRKKERLDEYTYNEKAHASVISSPSRSFLALELILEPSGKTTLEQSPTDGIYEKWVYIVEGELTCILGEEKFVLLSKDTISFDSAVPHIFENNGRKKCICTIITNPKHF